MRKQINVIFLGCVCVGYKRLSIKSLSVFWSPNVALAIRDLYESALDVMDSSAMEALLIALANLNEEQRVAGLMSKFI